MKTKKLLTVLVMLSCFTPAIYAMQNSSTSIKFFRSSVHGGRDACAQQWPGYKTCWIVVNDSQNDVLKISNWPDGARPDPVNLNPGWSVSWGRPNLPSSPTHKFKIKNLTTKKYLSGTVMTNMVGLNCTEKSCKPWTN